MKTHFEILLPLKYNTDWLNDIRSKLQDLPVLWQNGYYHITVAFINDTPRDNDICKIIEESIMNVKELKIKLDKLDAFTITSG